MKKIRSALADLSMNVSLISHEWHSRMEKILKPTHINLLQNKF